MVRALGLRMSRLMIPVRRWLELQCIVRMLANLAWCLGCHLPFARHARFSVRNASAGKVLYNWRVFPISLDEAPLAAFASAPTLQQHAQQQKQDLALLQEANEDDGRKTSAEAADEGGLKSGGSGLGRKDGGVAEKCRAWPKEVHLLHGPVIHRWAAW
jgi:hypothetical protein